jgi:hypothetical protein
MNKKEQFLDQIRELDIKIAEMEILREEFFVRLDKEIEKEGKL